MPNHNQNPLASLQAQIRTLLIWISFDLKIDINSKTQSNGLSKTSEHDLGTWRILSAVEKTSQT